MKHSELNSTEVIDSDFLHAKQMYCIYLQLKQNAQNVSCFLTQVSQIIAVFILQFKELKIRNY